MKLAQNKAWLPQKYQKIWRLAAPLLETGRSGDYQHAQETAQFILAYQGRLRIDLDILIPVALMHDIGHIAILPEHFKYVTGPQKIMNGKLVHMLTGAKIARDILKKIKYPSLKIREIVDIISLHDGDQLKEVDYDKIYNTANKKIFHDIDALDRYTEDRIKSFAKMYPIRSEFIKLLDQMSENFFYREFKDLAKQRLQILLSKD